MMNKSISNIQNNISEIYLVILFFGYVVASLFANLFNIDSRIFSVPFRIFVCIFSIYLLFRNFSIKKIKYTTLALLIFFIIYTIKSLYSFRIDYYNPDTLDEQKEFFVRIFAVILLPSLSLLFINYNKINWDIVIKYSFYLLFGALFLNLFYCIFNEQFNKTSGIFSVYYISSGHYGVSIIAIIFALLFYDKLENLKINKWLIYFGIFLGFFTIYISAARNPLLSLIIVILFLIIVSRKIKFLLYLFFSSLLALIIIYLLHNTAYESSFIERNFAFIFEGNISGRGPYLEKGIEIFKNNPIFGGRVLYEDFLYPHNLFIEILMSGGIILMIAFLIYYFPIIKNAFSYLDAKKEYYYVILFCFWLQYFFLSQTSYNFISVPEFWYFSTSIIAISSIKKNEKT